MKSLIFQLPDALYHEIISYVAPADGMEFSRITKEMCSALMKKVRYLVLMNPDKVNKLFESEQYRSKIFSMISNPYLQLTLFAGSHDLCLLPVERIALAVFVSKISDIEKLTNNPSNMAEIETLKISSTISSPEEDTEILERLIQEGRLSRIRGVKTWWAESINCSLLPNLPELTKIYISNNFLLRSENIDISHYKNLRTFHLYLCSNITDVSCLGRIHDLRIESCENITDVSTLNHNYSIIIRNCGNINDYSQAFRHCKVINITDENSWFPTPAKNRVVSLNAACEVICLTLCGDRVCAFDGDIIKLPPSPYLKELHLRSITVPFTMPLVTTLRYLELWYCTRFSICKNMGHIYYVKLFLTAVTSLEGLGKGNRVVHVDRCDRINDLSPLQYCDQVTLQCDFRLAKHEGYEASIDTRPLEKVKEVKVVGSAIKRENLDHVTSLYLNGTHSSIEGLLSKLPRLKEIRMYGTFPNEEQIFQDLMSHEGLEKIIFPREFNLKPLIQYLETNPRLKEYICERFLIESSLKLISLLRKRMPAALEK